MGLAASQCRILSLTSRMSNLELRAQMLSNQKVALSTASSQASSNYIKALNGEHLAIYSPSGEYCDATAELLTCHDAYTGSDQLFLRDEKDQILCSEEVLRAFNASGGVLENFLNRFGCTSNTDTTKNIKNIASLLSGGLNSISDSSETLRVTNLLKDATSGVDLGSISADYSKAQLYLDTFYSADENGNVISYLPLTEGQPSGFRNCMLNIANNLIAASCEVERDAEGNLIKDETGLYKIAPKLDASGNVIEDAEGNAEPNILNKSLWTYAEKASEIVSLPELNTNIYYYSIKDVKDETGNVKFEGISSLVLKDLNLYNANLEENGAKTSFNASAVDVLSKGTDSDLYKLTKSASKVLYDYYKGRGLSDEEMSHIINSTDIASTALMTEILKDDRNKAQVNNTWFESASIIHAQNNMGSVSSSELSQGSSIYTCDNTWESDYGSMINKYMAYFDAVVSNSVDVRSSMTSGTEVSGSGDVNYDQYIYVTSYNNTMGNPTVTVGKSKAVATITDEVMAKLKVYQGETTGITTQNTVTALESQYKEPYVKKEHVITDPVKSSRLIDSAYDIYTMGNDFVNKPKYYEDEDGTKYSVYIQNEYNFVHYDDESEASLYTYEDSVCGYIIKNDGSGEYLRRQMTDEEGNLLFDIDEATYNADKSSAEQIASEAQQAADDAAATAAEKQAAYEAAIANAQTTTAAVQTASANVETATANVATATANKQSASSTRAQKAAARALVEENLNELQEYYDNQWYLYLNDRDAFDSQGWYNNYPHEKYQDSEEDFFAYYSAQIEAAQAEYDAAKDEEEAAIAAEAAAQQAEEDAIAAQAAAQQAYDTAVAQDNAAQQAKTDAQSEAELASATAASVQATADEKLAAAQAIDPESYRYMPVWEYAVMTGAEDQYLRYTYTDENDEEKTVDLLTYSNEEYGMMVHNMPEVYSTVDYTIDGENQGTFELNNQTAEQIYNVLTGTLGIDPMSLVNESVPGQYTLKSAQELLEILRDYKNGQEQAKYDEIADYNERLSQVVTEIQSMSTTAESTEGYKAYSKHYAVQFKNELQAVLDSFNVEGLTKTVNDLLSAEATASTSLRVQLYNIKETVQAFLGDAGKFFGKEYPYTDKIDEEVQALKRMSSKRTFTEKDIAEIKSHIENICSLANIDKTIEVKYSGESTIAYYTSLFEALSDSSKNGKSPVGIETDKWNDSSWLQEQLKVGNIHVCKAENGQLTKKQYNTSFTYLSTDGLSDTELTKAQADYEAEVNRISKKEKRIDRELAMIETEHNALEQELNSIKQNKDDNIQRNFQLFS